MHSVLLHHLKNLNIGIASVIGFVPFMAAVCRVWKVYNLTESARHLQASYTVSD